MKYTSTDLLKDVNEKWKQKFSHLISADIFIFAIHSEKMIDPWCNWQHD